MVRRRTVRAVGVALALFLGLAASSAQGALTLYIGTDPGAGSADARPNSDAAAAAFDSAAAGIGAVQLINFEAAPLGTFTSFLVAPGVTLSGDGEGGVDPEIRNTPSGTPDELFGYNTTAAGANFVDLFGGFIDFAFTDPIHAFGAYISGLQLTTATVTYDDGSTQTIEIPDDFNTSGGGIAFVGFTDPGNSIVSVRINTPGDITGVDDVRYVYTEATVVPEMSTILTAASGLLPLVVFLRRRRVKRV
jgi:hypothetical protein